MTRWSVLGALAAAAACAPAAGSSAQPQRPQLGLPVACVVGRTCEIQQYMDHDPGPLAKDYRCGTRTYDGHSGVDFRLPDMAAQRAGVEVLAAAAGRVARLRDGVPEGLWREAAAAATQGRECGNGVVIDHGDGWETQYCHLARGSVRVKVGDQVAAGAPIGRVGLSGQTEFPHLHLTVRRAGATVDPFAPEAAAGECGAGDPLWTAAALAAMPYKAGAVLNAGFATDAVTMAQIEEGGIAPPARGAPYIVAYVRAIGLVSGDVVELELEGPGGAILARNRMAPLDRDKAQHFLFAGKRRPPAGWATGEYEGNYRVWRNGEVAIRRSFRLTL